MKKAMVIVHGDTYAHRKELEEIPGSKLTKVKSEWRWKIPQSQIWRLPKGLFVKQ